MNPLATPLPVGAVIPYAGPCSASDATGHAQININQIVGNLARAGWLPCDGRSLPIPKYFPLFGAIGCAFGGDGATYFNLPDLRGRFVRAVNDSNSSPGSHDPDAEARQASQPGGNQGNQVGSLQTDAFQTHEHDYQQSAGQKSIAQDGTPGLLTVNVQATTSGVANDPAARTSSETRPANVYLNHLIRYI